MSETIGVIGGMGPLASAEFIKTIYELGEIEVEQQAPQCVLYSDPTIPDRTECVLNGSTSLMITRLSDALERLQLFGVSSTVICCITMHCFLPGVATHLRRNIVSLIDVIVQGVLQSKRRHLLLCTDGARRARIFQIQDEWSLVAPYVVLPDSEDQRKIHSLIYRIKQKRIDEADFTMLEFLKRKYEVDYLIAGCTELHLLAKKLLERGQVASLQDPLLTLARRFAVHRRPDAEVPQRRSVAPRHAADPRVDGVRPQFSRMQAE